MAGWIKTYRDLADHWLAQDLEKLGWWVILLLGVNHEDKKVLSGNHLIELKRGQIVASLSYLAKLWKTSKRTAERFVELLEREQMVRRSMRQKVTILTICNWDSYQGRDEARCADTCADDAPIVRRSVSETKNEKECKEIIIEDTKPRTYTREEDREAAFAQEYRKEGQWQMAAMSSHLPIPQVMQIFEEFLIEQAHNSARHSDYPDFKKHFLNYLRVKAEVIRKQNKLETNNGNNRSNQRRGIQVVANSVEDYEGPF